MKPSLLVLLIVCASGSGRVAASDALLVSPAEVKMGDLWQGQAVAVAVTVTNNSGRPVELADVVASCACTEVAADAKALKPGESTKVRATLVREAPGAFANRLIISAKDKAHEKVPVTLSGNVRKTYAIRGRWTGPQERASGPEQMSEVGALPDIYRQPGTGLTLRIRGVRPDDPAATPGAPVEVKSPIFRLKTADWRPTGDNTLDADLHLDFVSQPPPGIYSTLVKFTVGGVSFAADCKYRVLGDVWTDRKQINLGRVVRGETKVEDLRLSFRDAARAWRSVEIGATEPPAYLAAVRLVKQDAKDGSVGASVEVDPSKLPPDVLKGNGFFHFTLVMRAKNSPDATGRGAPGAGAPGAGAADGEQVKVNVYGMVQ